MLKIEPTIYTGFRIPCVRMRSTEWGNYDILLTASRWNVYYYYPRDGAGLVRTPFGKRAPAFADFLPELDERGIRLFGVSLSSPEEQQAFADADGITFPLLSDEGRLLTTALSIPVEPDADGVPWVRPITIVTDSAGRMRRIFYPIADVTRHPAEVLAYLRGVHTPPFVAPLPRVAA